MNHLIKFLIISTAFFSISISEKAFSQTDTAQIDIGFRSIENISDSDMSDSPIKPNPDPNPGPADWLDVDVEPKILNLDSVKALIGYPEEAKKNCIVGKVTIRVLVDSIGRMGEKIVLLKSPHQLLVDSVMAQLKYLRFSPGIVNDKPWNIWLTIPFPFVLPECEGK